MPQTLSDALSRVRSNLEETTAKFWTDNELTNWINDGLRDVARRTESLSVYNTTIAAVAATAKYTLPNEVKRLHRVEYVPTGSTLTYPLQASVQQEMDNVWGPLQNITSSYPSYYVLLGFPGGSGTSAWQMQVYPVPASAGTFNLFYWRDPYRFTSGSGGELAKNLDIVEGWDDLIVLYCEFNAKRKDRNPEWKDVKQMYEEKLEQMMETTRNFHDQAQMMTSYSGAMVPQWLYREEW